MDPKVIYYIFIHWIYTTLIKCNWIKLCLEEKKVLQEILSLWGKEEEFAEQLMQLMYKSQTSFIIFY